MASRILKSVRNSYGATLPDRGNPYEKGHLEILKDASHSRKNASFLERLFKSLASLKLALFVLFSLIFVFALGTILESLHGAEAASLLVYRSFWFEAILVLLGINVAAAALDRYPWKKKHAGFVITHVGILLVLLGSFTSKKWMVDGQLAVAEGETEYRITLPEPLLYVYDERKKKDWVFPLKTRPFAWTGDEPLNSSIKSPMPPFAISLLTSYPKAEMTEEMIPSETGPPALKITIHNSFVNETVWLMQNHPERSQAALGPATVNFAEELLPEPAADGSETGYLELFFERDKSRKYIPFPQNIRLPKTFPIEGTSYQVVLLKSFQNAVVVGNQLMEEPPAVDTKGEAAAQGANPAVQLLLQGNGLDERHTVFAKYPEFPTQHGLQPSDTGVKILYRLPGTGSRGESHELRFVKTSEGLFYQVQKGLELKTGKVILKEDIPTGWMDLSFRVDDYWEHASIRKQFSPKPNTTTQTDAHPSVELEISKGNAREVYWLRKGMPEKIEFQGLPYILLYGEERKPLGFRIELRDFRVEHYPGTRQPASFESDVILKDDVRGIQREVTIRMNEPLIHGGYKIYQSGYSQAPGEPEISIFSVVSDPGILLKYAGAIVMITGMIVMFWVKRFSTSGDKVV